MGTTADKLNKLLQTKNQIAEAIREKGVSVSGAFRYYPEYIRSISQEVVEPTLTSSTRDVTFYDYDGTILHTYSKDEFLALTEMPALPIRAGLVCQGWNYTLEDAIAYVTKYGKLDIGATYITDDGKTRLYIKIADKGRMTVPLCFTQSVANGVTIDWGDGSAIETVDGINTVTITHSYTKLGDYVISLSVAEECKLILGKNGMVIYGNYAFKSMLRKVEIGKRVTEIGDGAFDNTSIFSVTIPEGLTSIDFKAFGPTPLTSIVVPKDINNNNSNMMFYYCYSLTLVVIPAGVTSLSFFYCYSLRSLILPESLSNLSLSHCHSLSSVMLCNNLTTLSFYYCESLYSVVIPEGVTSVSFQMCLFIVSIVLPSSVTDVKNSMFKGCHHLTSIVIPSSATRIGNFAFDTCRSLASIIIPSGVTSIEAGAFYLCDSLALYDFKAATAVPTLENTNAFQSIPSDCKIVVPDALYDEWIAATNWSTYASYIVKASEFTD